MHFFACRSVGFFKIGTMYLFCVDVVNLMKKLWWLSRVCEHPMGDDLVCLDKFRKNRNENPLFFDEVLR